MLLKLRILTRLFFSFPKDCDFLLKKRRFLVQNTKKVNCTAQIKLREVIKFPDYKVGKTKRLRRSSYCHGGILYLEAL